MPEIKEEENFIKKGLSLFENLEIIIQNLKIMKTNITNRSFVINKIIELSITYPDAMIFLAYFIPVMAFVDNLIFSWKSNENRCADILSTPYFDRATMIFYNFSYDYQP